MTKPLLSLHAHNEARRVPEVLAHLARVLASGTDFDAGRHVDPPGPHAFDGLGHVLGRESAREDHTPVDGRAFGQRPVEHLSGTRGMRVDEDRIGAEVVVKTIGKKAQKAADLAG